MEKNDNSVKTSLSNSALLLFLISLLSYTAILQYEDGFAYYFGIPSYMVSTNIFLSREILFLLSISIFAIIFIVGAIKFFKLNFPLNKEYLEYFLLGFNIFCLIFSLFSLIYLWNSRNSIHILDIMGNRLGQITFLFVFWISIKTKFRILLLLMIFISILSFIELPYNIGIFKAHNKENFLVLENNSGILVLNRYEDIFVCVSIDKKDNSYPSIFKFIKFKENPSLEFKYKKIGKLKPLYHFKK